MEKVFKRTPELRLSVRKRLNNFLHRESFDDFIFELAVFFLPFENLFFAPSAGWAAISPLFLAVYTFINIRRLPDFIKKYSKALWVLLALLVWGLIRVSVTQADFDNVVNSFISLGLGMICLYSLDSYYSKHKSLKKIVKIVLISYFIVMVVGIVEWITLKFGITTLQNFFHLIFKRDYLQYGRIQFFFTEPSFIGMHLFGILTPLYLIQKDKRLLGLIIAFCVLAVLFESGVRVYLDIIVVSVIFVVYYLASRKKYKLLILMPVLAIALFGMAYSSSYRIQKIVREGVYADGSLASRYFRINASARGYLKDPSTSMLGYGIGNSITPIRNGYQEALADYKSTYLDEVKQLGDPHYSNESVSYCLYTRLISEYGLVAFLVLAYLVYRLYKGSNFQYKAPLMFTMLYLYVQFESLAFYSLWIMVAILVTTQTHEKWVPRTLGGLLLQRAGDSVRDMVRQRRKARRK